MPFSHIPDKKLNEELELYYQDEFFNWGKTDKSFTVIVNIHTDIDTINTMSTGHEDFENVKKSMIFV